MLLEAMLRQVPVPLPGGRRLSSLLPHQSSFSHTSTFGASTGESSAVSSPPLHGDSGHGG